MYIVVNGGGKVGSHLAAELIRSGHDVVVVEPRAAVVDRLTQELPRKALVIQGDGCDDRVQREAGVARADLFASVTGVDSTNLVACRVARIAFDVPRVVSRISNPKNESIFRELGIEAVSATSIIARLIQEELGVEDIRTLSSLRRGNLAIVEIPLPEKDAVAGKTVDELSLPQGTVPVAFLRDDEVIPVRNATQAQPGDVVIGFTKVADSRVIRARRPRGTDS
jgi:trk system potassium uptake protein TrkA